MVQVDVLFQELYGDKNARNNVLPEYAEALCDSGIEDSVDGGLDPFTSAATTPSARPSAPPSQHTGQFGAVGAATDDGDAAMETSPVALGVGVQDGPLDPPLGLTDTAAAAAAAAASEAKPQSSSDAAAVVCGSQQGGEEETAPGIRAKRRTSAAEPDPLAQPPAATVAAPVLALDAVPEGSMPPGLLERLDPVGDAATGAAGSGAAGVYL